MFQMKNLKAHSKSKILIYKNENISFLIDNKLAIKRLGHKPSKLIDGINSYIKNV